MEGIHQPKFVGGSSFTLVEVITVHPEGTAFTRLTEYDTMSAGDILHVSSRERIGQN